MREKDLEFSRSAPWRVGDNPAASDSLGALEKHWSRTQTLMRYQGPWPLKHPAIPGTSKPCLLLGYMGSNLEYMRWVSGGCLELELVFIHLKQTYPSCHHFVSRALVSPLYFHLLFGLWSERLWPEIPEGMAPGFFHCSWIAILF